MVTYMKRSPETQLILDALSQPIPAISFYATEAMSQRRGDRHLFVAEARGLNFVGYSEVNDGCEVSTHAEVPGELLYSFRSQDHPLECSYKNGLYQIQWKGRPLEVLHLSWPEGTYSDTERVWVLAESEEVARDFYRTVYAWTMEIRGEVLVFHGGCWGKDQELFADISNFDRENLILESKLKDAIWDDFAQFFSARELYKQHGIPWKRGVLFTGPPGNGKSHTVKALVNELRIPCLYVKSLKSQYGTEHSSIRSVFKRARDTTPCLLVFEDLDSHIQDANRSFFLNELDGFAANEGILTLATSNYPERLDPAILERPSRFDRKYNFGLPALSERQAYLAWWSNRLEAELRLEPKHIQELAAATDGFSFAYLRELVLSSIMSWITKQRPMLDVMQSQLATLSEQMKSGFEAQPVDRSASPESRTLLEEALERFS